MNLAAVIRFREAIQREEEMRFSLKYDGLLLSSSDKHTRVKNKNHIRWYLADQVSALIISGDFTRLPRADNEQELYDQSCRTFKHCVFYPAICKGLLACNLTIRIERKERPGSLFEHDGDLDNRLKTLFDALKVPRNEGEVTDPPVSADGRIITDCPCLLEDDSMVTGLSVAIIPSLESLPKGHVRITIDVEIKPHDLYYYEEE